MSSIINKLGRYAWKPIGLFICYCLGTFMASGTTTNIWSGASVAGSNWSDGNSWSMLAAPQSTDAVIFLDAGTATSAGTPNNIVDMSFSGTIGSLRYANDTGFHTTQLAPGQTLNITGAGSLAVGTLADVPDGITVLATILGEGTVNLSNPDGNFVVQQSASGSGNPNATLDMSGLDTFVVSVNRIGIGTSSIQISSGALLDRLTGTVLLAKTNVVAAAYSDTLQAYLASGANNSLEIAKNSGNHGGTCYLYLGQANVMYLDSLAVGRDKSAGWMGFNPSLTNSDPTLVLVGSNGGSSRMKWWAIGDMESGSSGASSSGICDFSIGTINAFVDTISLARDGNSSHTASTPDSGTLTFSSGYINANTVIVGNQSLGLSSDTTGNTGYINVNGTNATLVVNSNLVLGLTTQNSVAATNTSGTITINGGTVRATTISVGAASANNTIAVNGGTLVVSNTIASSQKCLNALSLVNATLGLNVTGTTNVFTADLVTGGATNFLNLASVAFTSFPTQLTLIKYSGGIGGAGFNFGLGPNSLLYSFPGAYLSNDVVNQSVDLVLPNGPLPVIVNQPTNRIASVGATVSFTVGVSGTSATPLNYQWLENGTPIFDGSTGSGSTYSGTMSSTFSVNNAQIADSGNFTVVITNVYGAATSAPAALTITDGNVPPYVTGPTNLTVAQGSNATFSATVSGVPVPFVQWQKDGMNIPGANAASLTITSAQYPDDQTTYSVIATNIVGAVTNSAMLTVIAPPAITEQPQNATVIYGQSAIFFVGAASQVMPSYQWWKDGNVVPDATNSTLAIAHANYDDAGTYAATVANAAGVAVSSNATLTVNSGTISTTLGAQDYLVDPTCVDAYQTIQSAVNAVSGQSATNRANIYIAPGTYTELVTITQPYISLIGLGDSPTNVFITFAGVQFWYPTVTIAASATGFMARNIDFDNEFPEYDAIQTIALDSEADQVVFDHCYITGYQDTLFMNSGRDYLYNCQIDGDTDFNYGSATALFDHCTIVSSDAGWITAVNTPRTTAIGFVFQDCTLLPGSSRRSTDKQTSAPDNSVYLGRPWNWSQTNTVMSSATYIRTKMGPQIIAAGWDPWDLTGQPDTDPDAVSRYSEFGSTDLNGVPLPLDSRGVPVGRVSWADPMTAAQAANYTLANIFGGASTVGLWNTPGSQPQGTGQTYVDTRPAWDPLAQIALIPVPKWQPVAGNPSCAADRNMQMTITGPLCQQYRLWGTTNVASEPITNTWTLLNSGTFGKQPVTFKDTQSTNFPNRFYILTSP